MKFKSLVIATMMTLLSFGCAENIVDSVEEPTTLDKPTPGVPIGVDLEIGGDWAFYWNEPETGCLVYLVVTAQYNIDAYYTAGGNWFENRAWQNVTDQGERIFEIEYYGCAFPPYQDVVINPPFWGWDIFANNLLPDHGEVLPFTTNRGAIHGFITAAKTGGGFYSFEFGGLYTRSSASDYFSFSGNITVEDVIVPFAGHQFSRDAMHDRRDPVD